MSTGKVRDWLVIATNVGVIVGLALVGMELLQTQASMAVQINQGAWESLSEQRGRIVESEEVADLWLRGNAAELSTATESVRYEMLALELVQGSRTAFELYSLLGDAEWIIHTLSRDLKGNPGLQEESRKYLDSIKQTRYAIRSKELYPELMHH